MGLNVNNTIIAKTPMRTTLGGGGTDVLWYSKLDGGAWISAAINKYVYIIVTKTDDPNQLKIFDGNNYFTGKIEKIDNLILKECLKLTNIKQGVQLAVVSEVSSSSGLGGSGSFEVGLLNALYDFQNKKVNVLIATTIIENGLDLPNVNTLIVADSARLGLSQAYQIRGRIGRSYIQALAYFLYPKRLSEKAKLRLDALKEAEELGSGYRIALKDLEIRGAGNILGKEQSGSINAVGLNLYCQMLSEVVEKLKRE